MIRWKKNKCLKNAIQITPLFGLGLCVGHVSLSGKFQPFFIQVNTRLIQQNLNSSQLSALSFDCINLSHGASCHEGRVVTRVELSRGSSCLVGRVVSWVELSRGSSCLVGRVVSWVELSRGSSCLVGRVVSWVELSRGSSCLVGRVVSWVELSRGSSCLVGRVVSWVELSRGSSCLVGRVVRVELTQGSRCLMTRSTLYMYMCILNLLYVFFSAGMVNRLTDRNCTNRLEIC